MNEKLAVYAGVLLFGVFVSAVSLILSVFTRRSAYSIRFAVSKVPNVALANGSVLRGMRPLRT